MSFRDKAQIVVVSVAIALALSAGFFYVTGRITSPTEPPLRPGGIVGGTDDAPILIAGGSLYLGTDLPAIFTPEANKEMLVYASGYKVYRIDATDMNDVTAPYDLDKGSGKATIEISYCKNANCNGSDKDVVKVEVDNSRDPAVTITNSAKNIGKAPRLLPNLWVHPRRKNWSIDKVTVKVGTMERAVDCGDSECHFAVQTEK